MALRSAGTLANMDHLLDEIDEKRQLLHHVNKIREANPMRAFAAAASVCYFPKSPACSVARSLKPLSRSRENGSRSPWNHGAAGQCQRELAQQAEVIHDVARQVMGEHG